MAGSISPLSVISPSGGSLDGGYSNIAAGSHEDLATAAQQFEALMMQQMLQSSHDPDESWFGTGEGDEDDQANMQAMEIAQQQFASALAAQGGLGLAKMVVSHFADNSDQKDDPAVETSNNTSQKGGTHATY
jgi:Rod binding domain-containing protein